MSARRPGSGGYTLIEVMAALGVLALGATGVVALQKATLISNTNARNIAVANNIAMTWAERLRADALQWNDPGGIPDLASTDWVVTASTQPFPVKVAPTEILGLGAPSADVIGADIFDGDTAAAAFCTHLRFRQFTDAGGGPLWRSLIRVEIRVFWERSGGPIDCGVAPATVDAQPDRYGAVYLTTSVRRNTSQN
ncbi:type IV pilus modification PilV family protein [Sorangium sp. So ce131]|uniref:type IV pilus modification PilV family protein n=1 Tax=Sorangium sp. So ce131 TaxID=3133282 RepID=UPI003F62EC9A